MGTGPELRPTYCIDVLWSGCVGSIGPVALEGEVIFGSETNEQ